MNTRNEHGAEAAYALKKSLAMAGAAVLFLTAAVPVAGASIMLKVMAVNPSKDTSQTASVKAYLPKEAKPEDVLSKGDLQVIYDTQQGSYFVYGEFELKPGEVFEQEVELRDIWAVAQAEIDGFRTETRRIETQLKDGEFAERFAFLKKSIDARLDQVEASQKYPPLNPELHISVFRDNQKALDAVRADLDLARGFMAQARAFPPGAILKLIGGIVVFLGVLGGSFYLVWHRQLKVLTGEGAAGPASALPQGAEGPRRRGAGKEAQDDLGDDA